MSKHITEQEAEWLITVVGARRVLDNFDKPVAEWKITPLMREKILSGPHGILARNEGWVNYFYLGIPTMPMTSYKVRCNCGETFTGKLPSDAYRLHDAHRGTVRTGKIHADEFSA